MRFEVFVLRIARILAAPVVIATSACALVMTPQPDEAFIKGAIVEATPTSFAVRTKTGHVVQFQRSQTTELVAGERTVSSDCLTPATRVGVFASRDTKQYAARKIHVFSGRCLGVAR